MRKTTIPFPSWSDVELFFKNLKNNKQALAVIRIITVSIILIVSMLYMLPWSFISTSHTGYVSSRIDKIVAPINGTVSGLRTHSGQLISTGESIAVLRNDQADYGKLPEMLVDQARDNGQLIALETQIIYLQTRLASLELSSSNSNKYVLQFLLDEKITLKSNLKRRNSELRNAELIYNQKQELNEKGFASNTAMDTALTQVDTAKASVAEVESRIAQLSTQIKAIHNGVMIRDVDAEIPDANFLSFSVRTELYKSQREADGIRNAIAERSVVIKREEGMVRSRQYQDIISPNDLVVYSVEVSNNIFINKSDTLIHTIDCNELYIVAFIEQDHVNDISIGQHVKARVLDSDIEVNGVVDSIKMSHEIGDRDEFILNNHPLNDHDIFVVIHITNPEELFEPGTYCYVGASARLQILSGDEPSIFEWLLLWINKQ